MSEYVKLLNKSTCRLSLLALLFLLLSNNSAIGQNGWEVFFDDLGISNCDQIIAPDDGSFVVLGEAAPSLQNDIEYYLRRIDSNGELIWQYSFPNHNTDYKLTASHDGNYLVQYRIELENGGTDPWKSVFQKINPDGNTIWTDTLFVEIDEDFWTSEIFVNPDNSISFFGRHGDPTIFHFGKLDQNGNLLFLNDLDPQVNFNYVFRNNSDGFFMVNIAIGTYLTIHELDANGNSINTIDIPDIPETSSGAVPLSSIFQLDNDDLVIFLRSFFDNYYVQIKTDSQGNLISTDSIWTEASSLTYSEIIQVNDGFIITGWHTPEDNSPRELLLMKTNFDGDVLWTKLYNHRPGIQEGHSVAETIDGGLVVAGEHVPETLPTAYIIKTNANGEIYNNMISGRVAIDSNIDCALDTDDPNLEDWIVEATNTSETFITNSRADGSYVLPLDDGFYTITLHSPSLQWEPCTNDISITFSATENDTIIDFEVISATDCPNMSVSHSVPTIRPCFERPSYVNYCNYGTVTADSAYIIITYDSLITPISSSIAWTDLGDNMFRFDLGDLEPLECGSFTVNLFLDCEATVGASFCIEAHAYPDTLCTPPSSSWSGAFIDLSANCGADSVYLKIENVGSNAMTQFTDYIIVEDVILLQIDSVQLGSGEFEIYPFPANGATFSMIAEQVPFTPGFSFPSLNIEGCGLNGNNEFSVGFANQFPLNDFTPWLDIDCPVSVSSFDPNDKQGFPIGYTDEHFIFPNTPIEYLIRFQNTGTDTAFNVVIKDTIATEFDLATFQRGASSHTYDLEITGDIVSFNFYNIMLPDSNVNYVESNGFVEFTILPREDSPLGTVLRNDAAIYFDYNEAIYTNETTHTIWEDLSEVMVGTTEHPTQKDVTVSVYPNPFQAEAFFEIKGHEGKKYRLEIYDINGKLIREEQHMTSPFSLKRNTLNAGIYFYRLSAKDGLLNTGKIVIR